MALSADQLRRIDNARACADKAYHAMLVALDSLQMDVYATEGDRWTIEEALDLLGLAQALQASCLEYRAAEQEVINVRLALQPDMLVNQAKEIT